jgi:hypothetical protein
MNASSGTPFQARGRGELPATPRALLLLALTLAIVAVGAFVLVFTTLRDVTSGGVPIAIAWLLIGLVATQLSVRFAALGRTATRSCELNHGDQARAVCVGRERGPFLWSAPRVVTASDLGILVLRARLLREPDVIAAIPYRGIVRCQAAADSLELGTVRGELLGFAGVVPSQSSAFERVVSEHVLVPAADS